MNFLKDPRTNWKYILIVIILAFLVGGGILGWQWWAAEKEIKVPEVKAPEEKPIVEEAPFNLITTKLAIIPYGYDISSIDFKFSPDGERVAYVLTTRDNKDYIVLNGKEMGPYEDVWLFLFSPDGEHFVYHAKKEGKWFIVLDEKEIGPYDGVGVFLTTFSPDSKHLAYVVRKEGKWFIVLDGKEIGPYYSITRLAFSPDSKHFAYGGETEDWKGFAILDGKGIPYSVRNFTFTSNSKFGYCAWKEDKYYIILNEKEIGYSDDPCNNLIFSPDGNHFAYWIDKEIGIFVIFDGKEMGPYDSKGGVWEFTFSPDSKHFAYIAYENEQEYVVLDGKKMGPYGHVEGLTFSRDSKHFIYKTGKIIVLDGEEIGPYDFVWRFAISPNNRLAYAVEKEGKDFIILEGKEIGPYDSIPTIIFSPDGKHIAFGAIVNQEIWWQVRSIEEIINK